MYLIYLQNVEPPNAYIMKLRMPDLFKYPDSTTKCFAWLLVIIAPFVVNAFFSNGSINPDKPVLVMDGKTAIKSFVGKDTIVTPVKAGDSLQLLGYRPATSTMPHKIWVEAADGTRGFIDLIDIGIPLIKKKNKHKGDTVRVTGIDNRWHRYNVVFSDGTTDDYNFEKFEPAMSDLLADRTLNTDNKAWYMSKEKFERLYLGSTFGRCDSLYRPAIQVAHTDSGLVAEFEVRALDLKDGKYYRPIVTFNDSLVATSCTFVYYKDRSAWFLKRMPLVRQMVDSDWVGSIIQGPLYRKMESLSTPDSWWMWAVFIVFAVLYLGGFFIWVFATCGFLVLLMGFLVRYRFVFYPLSDGALTLLMVAAAAAGVYFWGVIMLLWGMFWIFLAVFPFVAFYMFFIATDPLGYSPHDRCLGCRRLHTMKIYERRVIGEYDKWCRDSREGAELGRNVRRWDTWTDRITTRTDGYGNKHTETTKIDYQHHKETTRHIRVDNYNVLYHITEYETEYHCGVCGKKEIVRSSSRKELKRNYTGSHVETDVNHEID